MEKLRWGMAGVSQGAWGAQVNDVTGAGTQGS